MLFVLLLVQVGVNAVGKRIAADIGGVKKLHSLVTLIEGIYLFPWMVVLLVTQVRVDIKVYYIHCKNKFTVYNWKGDVVTQIEP